MAMHAGLACDAGQSMAYVRTDNRGALEAPALSVKSHKQLVNKIYRIALERGSTGVFYCNGTGDKIFDGNLDTLLQEVCVINKKTSDDADYLANSIASMNVRTKQEYSGNGIRRTEFTVQIRYRETAGQSVRDMRSLHIKC